jgi:hypothetical protein
MSASGSPGLVHAGGTEEAPSAEDIEFVLEMKERMNGLPEARNPGPGDLPCEAEDLNEEEAMKAAASERIEAMTALRKDLASAVAGRVSKGTRSLYRPYQACWEVSPGYSLLHVEKL